MNSLENIRNGIANGSVSLEEVNHALCDGIKQYYGASDLHFSRGYIPGSTMDDGYGLICNTNPVNQFGGSYVYVNVSGDTWLCSTSPDSKNAPIINPQDLELILGDFSRGKLKVYFVDSGREYDNLHDLRHDHLAMKLSGVI